MKLLVTDGAGYVGSVCSVVLISLGHNVTILDDFSVGNRDAVPEGATLVEGDMEDKAYEVLSSDSFDGVVHFATKSLVGESAEVPSDCWHNNVGQILRLFDVMRDTGTNNLIFSSTAATYGEPEKTPITEDTPTALTDPYGTTKLAMDYVIASHAKVYNIGAADLRYFNVAGVWGGLGENREVETRLVPLVLQAALGYRDKIMVFGNDWSTPDGTAVRDYIHIKDLADAHVLALESNTPGTHRTLNLGSGDSFLVHQVIETRRKVTGHPIPAEDASCRAGDPATLIAPSQRAMDELGWKPNHTELETIVTDAWEYTKALSDRAHSAHRQALQYRVQGR